MMKVILTYASNVYRALIDFELLLIHASDAYTRAMLMVASVRYLLTYYVNMDVGNRDLLA